MKKIDNGHITKILNNLEDCDFIRKYYTIGRNGKLKSSSCFYQLTDFYTIFYFTFHEKASAASNFFQQNAGKPMINTWLGLAFERVVSAHIGQVKKAIGIDKISTEHYSWRSASSDDKVQIDMVISRADKITNICEIKYSSAEYRLTKEEYLKIQDRVEVFKRETRTNNAVWPVLITAFGTAQGSYASAINMQLTVEDLF